MLVMSRKRTEEIVVTTPEGREIVITLVEIRGDKVRLGVQAATEVRIDRREVHEIRRAAA